MTMSESVARVRRLMAEWNRARHARGVTGKEQDRYDADLCALNILLNAKTHIDAQLLSRVTLVDETGRAYERWNLRVQLSLQDDGRTLKVFVAPMAGSHAHGSEDGSATATTDANAKDNRQQ